MFGIIDVPVAGAYHLVMALSGLITPALTIVLFTVAVRLLLHPLARAAIRGERARAVLAPKIRELQQKYGKNRERLAREVAKLQQSAGTSMFAGCLPMLIQIPFFIVMFRLFSATTVSGEPNALLSQTLLGTQLGAHASATPVFLALFALLTVVAWFSARLARRSITDDTPGAGLLRLLPYGSLLGAAVIPLAAGVYLLATTAWATAERAYLRKVYLDG
jgi:YidC/Oxa1 family membrane protein insertase